MIRKKAVRYVAPDPMNPPAILSSHQLADLLRKHHSTIHLWSMTIPAFAACVISRTKRSTWWSTQRLRDAGYLTTPKAP